MELTNASINTNTPAPVAVKGPLCKGSGHRGTPTVEGSQVWLRPSRGNETITGRKRELLGGGARLLRKPHRWLGSSTVVLHGEGPLLFNLGCVQNIPHSR